MDNIKVKSRRHLEGVVVSDKMSKTRVVEVSRVRLNTKYQKRYAVSTRLKAHDNENTYKTGDKVIIEETRPLSRDKRWRIISKVEKAANQNNI